MSIIRKHIGIIRKHLGILRTGDTGSSSSGTLPPPPVIPEIPIRPPDTGDPVGDAILIGTTLVIIGTTAVVIGDN